MKVIILVFVLCTVTNANAGMNKCVSGDKISYQYSPCPNEEDKNDFFIKYDLSKEQIQAAIDKKAAELAAIDEQRRLDQIAYDKERMIRAEEDRARAEEARSREASLQTDAMIQHNNDRLNIEHLQNEVRDLKQKRKRRFIYRPNDVQYNHDHEHHFDYNHSEHHQKRKQQSDDSRGKSKGSLGRVR